MSSDILSSRQVNRISGVVPAIVVDNEDPENRYRVRVMFPQWLCANTNYSDNTDKEDFISPWARIATFMGGPNRGAFFLPEPDDEVLVCFENGDIRYPYVVGMLWNGVDTAIHENKEQKGKNNYRSIKSRSGHILTFVDNAEEKKEKIIIQTKTGDDEEEKEASDRDGHFIVLDHSDGAEKIEVYDRKQDNYILIDSTNNKIVVETKTGDMEIKAKNKITMECTTLEIKSSAETKIEAGSSMKLKAGSGMEMDGGPTIKQKASRIDLN